MGTKNKTLQAALMAIEYGNPVTSKWVSDMLNISVQSGRDIVKQWTLKPNLYTVERSPRMVNGCYEYKVISAVTERKNDRIHLEHYKEEIMNMIRMGKHYTEIAKKLGCGRETIVRYVKRAGLEQSTLAKKHSRKARISPIDDFRSNKDAALWGMALGFNMEIRA